MKKHLQRKVRKSDFERGTFRPRNLKPHNRTESKRAEVSAVQQTITKPERRVSARHDTNSPFVRAEITKRQVKMFAPNKTKTIPLQLSKMASASVSASGMKINWEPQARPSTRGASRSVPINKGKDERPTNVIFKRRQGGFTIRPRNLKRI